MTVGTVKKSIAAMASRWFRKKVSQRLPTSGLLGARRSQHETVGSDTLKPSISSSPCMRGAPRVGFSAAIRKIRARISLPTGFRPPTCLAPESHFPYRRKPARCHSTTVRGVTRMKRGFPSRPEPSQKNPEQFVRCG